MNVCIYQDINKSLIASKVLPIIHTYIYNFSLQWEVKGAKHRVRISVHEIQISSKDGGEIPEISRSTDV